MVNTVTAFSLKPEDVELIKKASSLIKKRGKYTHHHLACALRTNEGKIILGLHICARIGRTSVCAEASAIATAIIEKPITIDRIVTTRHVFSKKAHNVVVVPPCGQCRELILQYGPKAKVIMQVGSQLVLTPIKELIPFPFHRHKREIGKNLT